MDGWRDCWAVFGILSHVLAAAFLCGVRCVMFCAVLTVLFSIVSFRSWGFR